MYDLPNADVDEESVWRVVWQENERQDLGEGVQNSGKTSTSVRSRDNDIE